MNHVFTFLEQRLMPPLNKVANLRFIRAIMQARESSRFLSRSLARFFDHQ